MTQHNSFPLRGGKAWPGSNSRGGQLDDGSGQLTDQSKNAQVNQADILEKRKGFIRGMDEQFSGPVCGLHRYTDECGVEWLLVADESGISIRQPFSVPVFENSDAYPFDSFSGDGDVDKNRWRNFDGYTQLNGSLIPLSSSLQPMVWFKEASSLSYQTRIQWAFDRSVSTDQKFNLIIKAADASAQGARLEARMSIEDETSDVLLQLVFVDAALLETILLSIGGGQASSGFLTVNYRDDSRVAGVEYFPELVSQSVQSAEPLTVAQATDLGQFSALGIQLDGIMANTQALVIDGGPI